MQHAMPQQCLSLHARQQRMDKEPSAPWRQLTTAEHHFRRLCGKNSSLVCPKRAARKGTTTNKGKLTTIRI
ncbi:MAG: hypothetical protein SPE38_08135 [Prevotella sp.]|nr:hypothetical protein [Bacteroidales bacterium]MDY4433025.1 hypothetical protein [Prevotella sp.]